MKNAKTEPLGELLKRFNYITDEQMQEALKIQKTSTKRLGEILVEKKYIHEKDLVQVLEFKLGIPHADLSHYVLDPDLIDYIPEKLARMHKVVPIERKNKKLLVAMANPMDIVAIDDLRMVCNLSIEPLIASSTEVLEAIDQLYTMKDTAMDILEAYDEVEEKEEEIAAEKLHTMIEEAPIVRLASLIITKAIQQRASDIHVEPQSKILKVRFRTDGILSEGLRVSIKSHLALVSRFKIMANMDIAEHRRPQDGRIQLKYRGNEIDIRVSTLTTVNGEKVVMRILNKGDVLLNLNQLGFSSFNLKIYSQLIKQPHGIILVTGPTGSGKSTTLLSALNEMNSEDSNITTVEDPVEYNIDGINQIQVNPKAGIEFANTLRAILRQDPDVIMIGEIRDVETAQIAIRAALTGHLVLSSLHTNDAASTVTRLVDMGIKPYMVATAIIGVVAQRLIRKICEQCKVDYEPSSDIRTYLGMKEGEELKIFKGEGCIQCNQTGYRGRSAIHEILVLNPILREMINRPQTTLEELRTMAIKEGMRTLREDGKEKILQGITTPEEIMRVTV